MLRRREAVEAERVERLDQDHHAGDDRRRPVGMQTDHLATLGIGQAREPGKQQAARRERDDVAVHLDGVVGVERLVDRGQGGGRPGDRDRMPHAPALGARYPSLDQLSDLRRERI